MASGVAHRINNPLGGLFNCLQMLKQKADDRSSAKVSGLIGEGTDRIENTVNKLLWMSRKTDHSPVDMNVRNSVESVYSFMEYKMKKGECRVRNDVPPGSGSSSTYMIFSKWCSTSSLTPCMPWKTAETCA